ncbi:MAG: LuxR C-terminal-related transcriptional regulator [Chloroflexi bacterium]|nr:LuxR C-terminal-related transcriptional regulator [Chloroflexota bacterium]
MSQDGETSSLAEVLCALSFATDTSMGQAMEHGLKSGYIGLRIADLLHLGEEDRQGVFYGALLKDAGCTACAAVFASFFAGDDIGGRSDGLMMKPDSMKDALGWFWRHAPRDGSVAGRISNFFSFLTECQGVMKESITSHCEVGEMFARRLGLPLSVQTAVRCAWERWDGKGLAWGLKGAATPVAARILHVAQVTEVAHSFAGTAAANAMAAERSGADFDPEVAAAFLQLSRSRDFWRIIEQEEAQQTVLAMRPAAPYDQITGNQIETVCEVLADFADIKSRSTWNHSLTVAQTAVAMAQQMRLPQPQVGRLRRASLVHDLGKAAIPVGILDKRGDLTSLESELFRMHPYFTERVLARIAPLGELIPEATSHHEWIDGRGYHRGTKGEQIPLGGRILSVADAYVTRGKALGEGAGPEQALWEMHARVGTQFDGDCYEALVGVVTGTVRPMRTRAQDGRAAHLTDREVEVIQLVAAGLTNREIAQRLVITNKTVEHHLDHIYTKIGVSSRTSAVVFAVHQGLVQ